MTPPNIDFCQQDYDSFSTVLSILLCLGTFLSYLPQHLKIIYGRTSEGISPYFVLLGTLGADSNLINILVLQFSAFQCCQILSIGNCVLNLLGVVQIGVQAISFFLIFILFILFFPISNRYKSTSLEPTLDWKIAIWVSRIILSHLFLCLLISGIFIIFIGPQHPLTRFWGSFLGIISVSVTSIQYLPQIYKTWTEKRIGALSIPMMLIQTPGGFLFAYTIAIRPNVNWTSWITYFMAAIFQGILLLITLYIRHVEKSNGYEEIADASFATENSQDESDSVVYH